MSDLALYSYFRSSTAYRARIALNWKDLKYDYRAVHLLNNGGEQNSSDYRKINPIGGVPSLVHQGKVLSQSMAIIEYLDDVFPEKPLFPKGAYDRAKVKQICENINCDIHPLTNLKVMQYLEKNLNVSSENRERWILEWISKGLHATEQLLSSTAGMFSYGDEVSAADIFLVPQIFSANRFKVPLDPYPIIKKIHTQCVQLTAFKNAHPHAQPDTPEDLKGKI